MSTRLLIDAAKVNDGRRARSRQKKVGASDVGVCRRRAGFVHHGTPISDSENATGMKAIAGTWYHAGALKTMAREWGALIEVTVEDDLLRGHIDAIHLPDEWRAAAGLPPVDDAPLVVVVEDLKTRDDARSVDIVRINGPKRSEKYQAYLYADLLRRGQIGPLAGRTKRVETALRNAIEAIGDGPGLPVEVVRLRYMARTGHEDAEYVYEESFDQETADEAWQWVLHINESGTPEDLPRDQDGPGLSIVCDNCQFLRACWGEPVDGVKPQAQLIVTDDDLATALAEYDRNRAIESAAKKAKDVARAKLDQTGAAIYVAEADPSKGFKVSWSGGREVTEVEVDVDAMVELIKDAGVAVPMKTTTRLTSKSIGVVPWERPDPSCGKPVGDPDLHPMYDTDGERWWSQNRPRGGWTGYEDEQLAAEETAESLTAGQFAKKFPDYVDPRPPCILKPKHSGDCADETIQAFLDLDDDPWGLDADPAI